MVKNKIFQYFFIEFFKIFILVSLSFSLLIWFSQAARLLSLITEFGNPVSIYVKYLIFSYPKILDNTYLLNFIISLFFLFAKLDSQNEMQIYWLSGISKLKIYSICVYIGLLALIINIILSNFIAPWSSYQGRLLLGNSKFTLINALVKEKNFNSPLGGLTIFVEKNDKKGNLRGIFIYEKSRTITAASGEVLSDGNTSYLNLYNGTTQEKTKNSVNFIKFKKTTFDFSKYQLQNTSYPKFNERNFNWLITNLDSKQISENRKKEIREEINTRIIKPFLIIALTSLISFLIFSNNEKINSKKLKFFIFFGSISLLILNQIALGISGKNINSSYAYLSILLMLIAIINLFFFLQIKNENKL